MKHDESRLYEFWAQAVPSAPAFHSFRRFRAWALGSGYDASRNLCRRDGSAPFSPENCFWAAPGEEAAAQAEAEAAWDLTVDRIRLAAGLPPILASSPCGACPDAAVCADGICIHRARYWESSMEKLKGVLCDVP